MEKTLKKSKTQRIDKCLSEAYPCLSNRQIQEALEHRLVTGPNGETLKKGGELPSKVQTHALEDHICHLWSGNEKIEGVKILYEEKDYIVIDKPAGIPSHPLGLFDTETVTNWVLAKFPRLVNEFNMTLQPTLCPHRLDTDTSGLLIVCLSRKSFEKWRVFFNKKQILKTYLAWCWGTPKADLWIENRPMAHDKTERSKMVVLKGEKTLHRPPVLSATTCFRVLKRKPDRFLVEAQMKTGVTHQVRLHLAAAGFPLLGDQKYDQNWKNRPEKIKKHLLRATQISMDVGKRLLEFRSDSSDFTTMY